MTLIAAWILSFGCGGGASDGGDSDADSDVDTDTGSGSDSDTNTDTDTDVDCGTGGPAGEIPILRGCGSLESIADAPVCAEDVGDCVVDGECAVASLDDCCGFDRIGVLTDQVGTVEARRAPCPAENPACDACVPDSVARCVAGRCEVAVGSR